MDMLMSRTDKDVPDWVRVLHHPNPSIHHHWRCEFGLLGWSRAWFDQECDLDNTDDPRANRCSYWIDEHRNYWTTPPSRERVHLHYFGPERAAVRDSLKSAMREYNATGEVEADPPTRQARRSTWAGGWWD